MYEPWNLTRSQAAMVSQSKAEPCPSDAPTDREYREHRDSKTISASEWKRYAGK